MKKNFLIMMIMVLCAGFTFAQNTVRGFVPAAGTSDDTYGVFGQPFGDIVKGTQYEVSEGLAQAQVLCDTVTAAVGCGDSLTIGEFTLSAEDIQAIVEKFEANPYHSRDTFLTIHQANAAEFNYDLLLVLHLFVCPCSIKDADQNTYEVIAIDNLCWTKSNMRTTTLCENTSDFTLSYKRYSTDITPSLNDSIFGLLYTWENASAGYMDYFGFQTGICPCGWHLPTAEDVDTILKSNTDALRSPSGYWVVPEGITNSTKFSAEPAGYYDSLATRFQGFHSEADFWYVSGYNPDTEACEGGYFQILYFCDKPKQEPRNVNTDAMSVRCVRDMIYEYNNAR